jgi:hypothetical protein
VLYLIIHRTHVRPSPLGHATLPAGLVGYAISPQTSMTEVNDGNDERREFAGPEPDA